jgi:hypothetical protein
MEAAPPAPVTTPAAEPDPSGTWGGASRPSEWPPLFSSPEPVEPPVTMPPLEPPAPPVAPVAPVAPFASEPLPTREPFVSYEPAYPPPTYVDSANDHGPDGPSLREPDPGSPFASVPLIGDSAPSSAPPVADARPMVLGMACIHGHLTDPSSDTCLTCGASMLGRPPVLQEGPRPPLGALLLDDGSAYVLDVDYVLGREPQQDPEVVAGAVRPLKITDVEGVVSRKHVRVALVGWEIQVVDLGSANGTFVQYPGDAQSHPLVAHQPIVVRPGTQVTMGRRWFRVEALSPEMPGA